MPERQPRDPLRGVGPVDALAVLRQLVSRHPSLTSEVRAILREQAAQIRRQDVAEELTQALLSVRIEDVWASSGRTAHGYVDPGERAMELLLEAADETITQMERLLEQGAREAATEVLLGVVLAVEGPVARNANPVVQEVGEDLSPISLEAARRWRRAGGGSEGLDRISAIAPGWGRTLVGAFAR